MSARGLNHTRLAATTGVATIGLLLVACGNDAKPAADSSNSTTPSVTAPSTTPTAPGMPTSTATLTPTSSKPTPTAAPSAPSQTPTAKPVALTSSMLLTGSELTKADPHRHWATAAGKAGTPLCGTSATRGRKMGAILTRSFSNDLDASGGQWLTVYRNHRAAVAAYKRIVATIESCKAARPAPSHSRKITENRSVKLADATRIVRWYDYPLPSDPGSEDGGFPHVVTLKGSAVSVLAFRETGKGVKPANFERIARSAAAHLS